jgi:peptidyl-prolyl cis-trans isomerase SurA
MKSGLVFLLLFFSIQLAFSQNNNDAVFLTIGKQNISTSDFERIYNKNNSISSTDKQTVEEYLPMFINFKLKVQAAIDAGYDTLTSFKTELKGYRDQLAKSYLTDNSAVDSLIQEAYLRMHTEVNASHIMVALKIDASPEDTLAAWKKIMEIRKRVLSGESFEKLAFELSEDPSAKNNKGNLGYFTAFQMVYPFESAVYNNKVGEVSMPVRSRFGYHLIRTNAKRPARGEIKVAHIMLMVPQGSPDSVWTSTERKIKDIAKQLKEGADFATIAKERSEDRGSARSGGELPTFGAGRMVPEFDEAAFKLQYPGEISEPVRTFYGWHIIKLIEKYGIPEFEKIKQDLKSRIARDERAEAGSNSFISHLKREYKFNENKSLLTNLYQATTQTNNKLKKQDNKKGVKNNIPSGVENSSKADKKSLNLNIDKNIANQELLSFADQKYQLSQFVDYLKQLPAPDSSVNPDIFVNSNYDIFVKNNLLLYEDNHLEEKYPEFKSLIQEYHDGILLFNLSDSLVWTKASKDSAGLQRFYNEHISSYTWPLRLEASIISSKSNENIQKALKVAKKLKTPESISRNLTGAICDTINKSCIAVNYNKFIKGESQIIDTIVWKKGFSKVMELNGEYQFVVIHNVLQPAAKTLDESRGLVISDYQNYLDSEWISNLRKKYTILVNNEILNQLKNKYDGKN